MGLFLSGIWLPVETTFEANTPVFLLHTGLHKSPKIIAHFYFFFIQLQIILKVKLPNEDWIRVRSPSVSLLFYVSCRRYEVAQNKLLRRKRVKNWQISMFTSLDRASELHHHHKFLAGVWIPCPKAKKCVPQVIRCDPALLILLKTSSSAGAHRDSRVPTAKVGPNKDMDRCHMQLMQKKS